MNTGDFGATWTITALVHLQADNFEEEKIRLKNLQISFIA